MDQIFVGLTMYGSEKWICVNMAHVCWYGESAEGGSLLYFELGAKIHVKESVDEIGKKVVQNISLKNEIVSLKEMNENL